MDLEGLFFCRSVGSICIFGCSILTARLDTVGIQNTRFGKWFTCLWRVGFGWFWKEPIGRFDRGSFVLWFTFCKLVCERWWVPGWGCDSRVFIVALDSGVGCDGMGGARLLVWF